jgi:hypothetical protein
MRGLAVGQFAASALASAISLKCAVAAQMPAVQAWISDGRVCRGSEAVKPTSSIRHNG